MNSVQRVLLLSALTIQGPNVFAASTQIDCDITRTAVETPTPSPEVQSVRLDVWAISKQSDSVSKDIGTLDGKQVELMAYVTDESTQSLTLQINEKLDETNSTLLASTSVPETGNFFVMYRSLPSNTLLEIACNASVAEDTTKPTQEDDDQSQDTDAAAAAADKAAQEKPAEEVQKPKDPPGTEPQVKIEQPENEQKPQ